MRRLVRARELTEAVLCERHQCEHVRERDELGERVVVERRGAVEVDQTHHSARRDQRRREQRAHAAGREAHATLERAIARGVAGEDRARLAEHPIDHRAADGDRAGPEARLHARRAAGAHEYEPALGFEVLRDRGERVRDEIFTALEHLAEAREDARRGRACAGRGLAAVHDDGAVEARRRVVVDDHVRAGAEHVVELRLERECGRADADQIAGRERARAFDRRAVQRGAVGAPEVLERRGGPSAEDRVLSADGVVEELNRAVAGAPDRGDGFERVANPGRAAGEREEHRHPSPSGIASVSGSGSGAGVTSGSGGAGGGGAGGFKSGGGGFGTGASSNS